MEKQKRTLCNCIRDFKDSGNDDPTALKNAIKYQYFEKFSEESDSCVSRKISILKDEHPDWSHEQIVAVALSMCGKSKNES